MSIFGSGGRKQDESTPVRERTQRGGASAEGPEETSRRRLGGTQRPGRTETQAGGKIVASFGKSIVFKGDLTGDEDLEIEGRVEGQVKLPNHQLTIGAHGRVKAQVEAKTVVVVGHVAGNVLASERVEVQASGVVDGDIQAPRLQIQEGAVVNGSIQMGAVAAGKTPGEAAPETPAEPSRKTG
jgi:cytoskeletal protein CcmA (bactofilin family)